jgi:hypothetical protein
MVLEVEESTGVGGAEDLGDIDRIRDSLRMKFVPRVPIKRGPTAGSEMTLPFLCKFQSVILDSWYHLTVRAWR